MDEIAASGRVNDKKTPPKKEEIFYRRVVRAIVNDH